MPSNVPKFGGKQPPPAAVRLATMQARKAEDHMKNMDKPDLSPQSAAMRAEQLKAEQELADEEARRVHPFEHWQRNSYIIGMQTQERDDGIFFLRPQYVGGENL